MVDSVLARTAAVQGIATNATYAAVYTAAPTGGTAGTELAGVARQPLSWATPSNGQSTATATFTGFGAGAVVAGTGFHSAVTAGNYYGGTGITSRTMQVGDTLTVTYTLSAS